MNMNILEQIFTVRPFNSGDEPINGAAGTKLTITEAPTSIDEDKECTIKGKIEIVDWPGGALKSATVKFSYNGTSLGTATTDILGIFIKKLTFNEAGILYVLAQFEGVEDMFNPSGDFVRIVVNEVTPPPSVEGNAQLIEITLPDTLNPGDTINGIIRVKNIGEKDTIRLQITREWLKKTTYHTLTLEEGQVMRVSTTHTMPKDEAKYTFKAQHKEGLFAYITDDTATYTITTEPPDDEEPPVDDDEKPPPEEEKTFIEELTEAWNTLEGWQKALIAGTTIIGAVTIAKPYTKR